MLSKRRQKKKKKKKKKNAYVNFERKFSFKKKLLFLVVDSSIGNYSISEIENITFKKEVAFIFHNY